MIYKKRDTCDEQSTWKIPHQWIPSPLSGLRGGYHLPIPSDWVISMKKSTVITDTSQMWGLLLKCHFLINHSWCALRREFVIGSNNNIRLKYGIISWLVISFSRLRFSFRLLVLLKTLMDDDIKDNCNYFLNKPLPNVDGS